MCCSAAEPMPVDSLLLAWTVLAGMTLGGLSTVVLHRLPLILAGAINGEPSSVSLSHPGSGCPVCQHRLAWYDIIPIFGYLLVLGRCRHCKTKIPIRYWLIEVSATAFGAFGYYYFGVSGAILGLSGFLAAVLVVAYARAIERA